MLQTTNIVVTFYIQIFEPVTYKMGINGKKLFFGLKYVQFYRYLSTSEPNM